MYYHVKDYSHKIDPNSLLLLISSSLTLFLEKKSSKFHYEANKAWAIICKAVSSMNHDHKFRCTRNITLFLEHIKLYFRLPSYWANRTLDLSPSWSSSTLLLPTQCCATVQDSHVVPRGLGGGHENEVWFFITDPPGPPAEGCMLSCPHHSLRRGIWESL